jgi:hypothetical protein
MKKSHLNGEVRGRKESAKSHKQTFVIPEALGANQRLSLLKPSPLASGVSLRALDCLYISDDGGRERYRGTIDKYG